MNDLISRQAAIDAKQEFRNPNVVRDTEARTAYDRTYANGWNDCNSTWINAIKALPSAEPEQWNTCFDCPLSHGCPVINGCTNEQAMEYAGEIPDNCPLSAEPQRKKGEWKLCTDERFDIDYYKCSECGYEPYRKMDISNFCPNCGADMRGEQE